MRRVKSSKANHEGFVASRDIVNLPVCRAPLHSTNSTQGLDRGEKESHISRALHNSFITEKISTQVVSEED